MSDGADEGTWRGNGWVTLEQTIAGDVSESLVRPSQLSSLQRGFLRTNDAKKRQALDGITERRRRGTGRGVCGCAAAEGKGTGCSEKPGRTRGLKLDMSRGGQARVWVGAAAESHPPSWLYYPDPSTERGKTNKKRRGVCEVDARLTKVEPKDQRQTYRRQRRRRKSQTEDRNARNGSARRLVDSTVGACGRDCGCVVRRVDCGVQTGWMFALLDKSVPQEIT
jgi:hypothetical protein